MIPSPFQNCSFAKPTPSVEFLTEQVINNLKRLAELEKRVPNYLKERAFAFVDLRAIVITLEDIEEYEYDTADVNQFCERADEVLSDYEKSATKLGY